MIKLIWILTFLILGIQGCEKNESGTLPEIPDLPEKETHHPFLIVTKDMYPALREKAAQEPWFLMKADAVERSKKGSSDDPYKLQEFVGAAALAYILDETNANTHATRVKNAILDQYSKLKPEDGGGWGGVVPHLGSFFSAILALDIVYDALSVEDIAACEEVIETQIFKLDREGAWVDVRYGTHGTWDIYKGNRTTPDDKYYEGIMKQITPDGVSPVTNHYAWERVGGGNSRVSKSGYMDVLEFTGVDQRYYNNERLQKFQRWLFGSSVNCAKEMAIFGDMLPTQGIANDMLHRRVINFDMEAAGYAAWFHEGRPAYGHILTYILPKQALPEPLVPKSKLYNNGGAFFREREDNPDGLHAVLYNIKSQDEWHTHNEVNGLALSGLGNRLLVNGGRLGAPTRAADLNNTLTINGENHNSRLGNGIVTGFTADELDFAIGDAGHAISSGSHKRGLVLVHSADGAKGYFLLFDEVKTESIDQIKNFLHPANETSVAEVIPGIQYEAAIDHYPTVQGSSVGFYYITPPLEVNVEKSQSAVPDRYPGYPEHNRLESLYNVSSEGQKNLATLIYPFGPNHPKADIQKISGESFNGCAVSQENVRDYIFESMSEEDIQYEGINANSDFCLIRKANENILFYLAANGIKLKTAETGFESDSPITIYARGKKGTVISSGAKVQLWGNGIENIRFDSSVEVLDSGTGFIEVQLPEGTVYFE